MANSADIIKHVQDDTVIHFPFGLHWHIPQPLDWAGFHITKFMLAELLAAVLMALIFIPLARRVATGRPLRGRFWNMFEVIVLFIRNEVARPAIGKRDAAPFLPLLWNMFFFILFVNLLGLTPWLGSANASLWSTGALALIAMATVIGTGMVKHGPLGYWVGLVPPMDAPLPLKIFLVAIIFPIEVVGLIVRHFILAMRLFANMFAGHLVLAVVVGFLAMVAGSYLWYVVAPVSVLGAVALDMLELLVAFLQAYVFVFLMALFIGMAVHQH